MRLIDADALLKTLNEEKIPFNSDVNYFIMNAPTIDAVPVVRCKDCLSYNPTQWCIDKNGLHCGMCTDTLSGMPKDGFCSYARMRDKEK